MFNMPLPPFLDEFRQWSITLIDEITGASAKVSDRRFTHIDTHIVIKGGENLLNLFFKPRKSHKGCHTALSLFNY